MFKVSLSRDLFNKDPEKRNKITGIRITHGYQCSSACCCDCASKCKYRKGFKFHNWSVGVHRFFEYKLHIKLPHWLYINKHWTDLSGTTKCPFKKERRYSCHNCKYQAGYDIDCKGICGNKERYRLIEEGRGMELYIQGQYHCKLFEKNEWADKYNKDTGEKIWD